MMAFGNVYLEHMRQARELTGLPVDGASGQSGCYAGLKARNAEVCRLLEQNNLFLQSEVLPFLAPARRLTARARARCRALPRRLRRSMPASPPTPALLEAP